MTSVRTTVAVALVVSATYHAAAQVASFHAWLEAPSVVQAGDSFTVQLWVSAESELFSPTNYFSTAYIGFEVSGDLTAFHSLTPVSSNLPSFSSGTPDENSLRDVWIWQSDAFPGVLIDFNNPILVLTFDVLTREDSHGLLSVDIRPHSGRVDPWFEWTLQQYEAAWISTSDPDVTLLTAGTTIRVIPAPASAALLSLAVLAASRRRRSFAPPASRISRWRAQNRDLA